jgi:glycosyltransferase involved in cell wall biosynthesis
MTRQAVLVLGMHRSGTSALTRVISILGAALPKTLMTIHEDNPTGYWESQTIARFNNSLLSSAGTRWDSDAPIPVQWFADEDARKPQFEEARELIRAEFEEADVIVFKDPRLCLLFPFWERVLNEEGYECNVLICLRDPAEVANSLYARFKDSRLHSASIRSRSRTMLIWLRHVLEAERSTRHLKRFIVDYSGLLSDWRTELHALKWLFDGLARPAPQDLQEPQDSHGKEIDLFLNPQLRRQYRSDPPQVEDAKPTFFTYVIDTLKHCVTSAIFSLRLDELRKDFDRLVSVYAPLRVAVDRLVLQDLWSDRILNELQDLHQQIFSFVSSGQARPAILFVSRTSESRAHQYRVIHPVAQLVERGWNAQWMSAKDPELLESVGKAGVVVVSRGPWGKIFKEIRQLCSQRQAVLICDIDDLIFEPDVLEAGKVEHYKSLAAPKRACFMQEAHDLQSALRTCDAVFTTTPPLARAASKYARRSFVLPNCFGREMLESAAVTRVLDKPSAMDGLIRIGFASGTPTHTQDFGTIAEVLADFLTRTPRARLVILGYLDLSLIPALSCLKHQIERRPPVPLQQLGTELHRFDINLAPLELGNPFCEAKSEIRYTAASALGIPTIASATEPLCSAIIDGVSGFLVHSSEEWRIRLHQLADDPNLRSSLGEAARLDTMARFGQEKTARLVEQHLAAVFSKSSKFD